MKKVISKIDKKTYFKTVAKFKAANIFNNDYIFIKGERYWVRNAEESDNVDPAKFVIVKGVFFKNSDYVEWFNHQFTDYVSRTNGYDGTFVMRVPVPKEFCKCVLKYVD